MPSISTYFIQNHLNVNSERKAVQLGRGLFAPEWNKAIMDEMDKLLATNFIWEVYYLEWLANVVMVKKANRKLRMCVDFKDLNSACPR